MAVAESGQAAGASGELHVEPRPRRENFEDCVVASLPPPHPAFSSLFPVGHYTGASTCSGCRCTFSRAPRRPRELTSAASSVFPPALSSYSKHNGLQGVSSRVDCVGLQNVY